MIKINSAGIYLVDSAAMHTILKSKIYFTQMVIEEACVNTINGSTKMNEGSERATILFLEETY